jgi:hypothetical protein
MRSSSAPDVPRISWPPHTALTASERIGRPSRYHTALIRRFRSAASAGSTSLPCRLTS